MEEKGVECDLQEFSAASVGDRFGLSSVSDSVRSSIVAVWLPEVGTRVVWLYRGGRLGACLSEHRASTLSG